ncbi:Unknown protein, partial [Striga hermonthica]
SSSLEMEDELGHKLGKFTLSEIEDSYIDLDNTDVTLSEDECQRSLFGKIVGERKANWVGVKRTMSFLWKLGNSLEVRELGNNYFQFLFPNRIERAKILEGRNWIFENQHLILKEWKEGISANHPCFDELTLWVQAYGIPINWICTDVGIKIDRVFNGIKNVNMAKAGGQGGRVMRMQVDIDIKEPLPRWTKIRLGSKLATIQFLYEKLVSLCYYCGRVGHSDKNYSQRQEDFRNNSVHEGQYGEWMKAVDGVIVSQTPSQSNHSNPTTKGFQTQNTSPASGNHSGTFKQPFSKSMDNPSSSKQASGVGKHLPVIEESTASIPMSEPINRGKEIVAFSHPQLPPSETEEATQQGMELVAQPDPAQTPESQSDKQTGKTWRRAPSKVGRLARKKKPQEQHWNKEDRREPILKCKPQTLKKPAKRPIHRRSRKPMTTRGGLLLMWDSLPNVSQVNSSDFFIQIQFTLPHEDLPHSLTFVYMSTDRDTRIQQWNFLEQSKDGWGDHWVLTGDWNDICNQEEKRGGRTRPTSSFNAFNDFISAMGMFEITLVGYQFTWGNNRALEGFVEEKLDKGFGSLAWTLRFPQANISNIFKSASDHGVLLVDTQNNQGNHIRRFTFDKRWINREGCKEEVQKAWALPQQGTPFFKLKEHVKQTRVALMKWSKLFRAEHKKKVASISLKLEEMRQLGAGKKWDEWESLKHEMETTQTSEEAFWQQKSRVQWLKKGDRNTNFFHAFTMQRRKKNAISRLLSDEFGLCITKEEIAEEIARYYKQLYTSEGSLGAQEISQLIPKTITHEMNLQLQAPIYEEEIK